MASTEVFAQSLRNSVARKAPIKIRELGERDRRGLLVHFLALGPDDRLLRFGILASDEVITRYVQKINFSRDAVFGVYDDALRLVGVGQLVYLPKGAMPALANATLRDRIAEFGVSVLTPYQGQGIGTRLLERAIVHCRNEDIDTLYVHYLTSNKLMMHIAAKAGMEIHSEHGEADAYLKLPPADTASVLQEALEEKRANFDYSLKTKAHNASRYFKKSPNKY